jgi:hypothetical protein
MAAKSAHLPDKAGIIEDDSDNGAGPGRRAGVPEPEARLPQWRRTHF